MTIATRFRSVFTALIALVLLPRLSHCQGILPSQWVYDPITSAFAVSYSPDGKLIALAGDGGVQLWKTSTMTLVTCLPTQAGEVRGLTFSPNGKTLAISGSISPYDNGGPVIELWNVTTGTFIRSLNSQSTAVYSVAFSPDGKLLADGGWFPTRLEVWDVATGNPVASLNTGLDSVDSIQFAPNGKKLAAGGYVGTSGVEIWDVSHLTLLRTLKTAATEVFSVSFSPDGSSLAAAGFAWTETQFNNGTAEIWDVASGKLNGSLQSGSTSVDSLSYSPDGKTLAVACELPYGKNDVALWDASTFTLVSTLDTQLSELNQCLAFSPDGRSLATFTAFYGGYAIEDEYTELDTWDVGNYAKKTISYPGLYAVSNSIVYSGDGQSIVQGGLQVNSSGADGWIGIWNTKTLQLVASFNSTSLKPVTNVAISSDGSLVADIANAGWYGSVLEFWNVATRSLIASINLTGITQISSLTFSPVGDFVAATGGGAEVQLWNASSGGTAGTINTSANNGVTSVAFSPDGNRLLTCGSMSYDGYQIGVLEVWNVQTGQIISSMNTGLYSLSQVGFSHDGAKITDGGLRYIPSQNKVVPAIEVWSSPSEPSPLYLTLSNASNPITTLTFSRDDKTIFAAVNQGIQAFDTSSGNPLALFDIGGVSQLSLSPIANELAYTMNGLLAITPIPSFGGSQISAVSLNPSIVLGGATCAGTVTLSRPAPARGIDVNLSSNSSFAVVQPSVVIPAGSRSATFTLKTSGVDGQTSVFITAEAASQKRSTTLTINPPKVGSVQFLSSSVAGGQSIDAFINLTGPAGPRGVVITLKSNLTVASVPVTANIYPGGVDALITINTKVVAAPTTVIVTATFGGISKTGTFVIMPPALANISLDQYELVGGASGTGTVYSDGPALAGGMSVTLSSNSTILSVPNSVLIPEGKSSVKFTFTTVPVAKSLNVTLTAIQGGVTKIDTLTVDHPTLNTLSLNPNSVQGGQASSGIVVIGSVAPAGGLVITLASNISAATVPARVTIPAGKTSITFTIQTSAVSSTTGATITATVGNSSLSAVLSIH